MKRAPGFTLIELIVVIAVIAILATITIVGFSRYQTETADSQRTAKATTISEALEKYYDQHGEYPSCADLSNATASSVVGAGAPLEGVEQTALITPQSSSSTNSISCSDLTSINGNDVFAYVGDGSPTCSTAGGSCLSYTLKYKDQTDGTIASIQSRHTTSGSTSGGTTLSIGTPGFTTDSLSWTAVPNATGYILQLASSAGALTANGGSPVGNVTTYTSTGLSPGSTQYYEVRPTFVGGQSGNWSNVVNDTTWILVAPTLSVGTIGPTSLSYTWTSVPHADASNGYTYQLASDAGFTTILDSGTTSSTSHTTSGLTTGVTYYVEVRATAVASPSPSPWSNVIMPSTAVPAPSTPSVSFTNTTGSTSTPAVTCSLGTARYERETTYRTDGSTAENYGAWTAWQTTTGFGDFISGEGMFGIAKVGAECLYNGIESAPVLSSAINEIRPITSIGASTGIDRSTAPALIAIYGSCPSGTTAMYIYGQIYHGSAGTHSGGGWGAGSGFEVTNGTPNYSYNDGLNVYRVSRTICDTPYWERSTYSAVPGNTLQGSGLTAYNNFVGAGYSYSVAR